MNTPTTVASLACDETTARRLADYLAESLDTENTACAAFEGNDGQWRVAVHFSNAPDVVALRGLVSLAAGEAAAEALRIEPVAPADWVARSLAGLQPVRAGRFIVHGAHDRARVRPNDVAIEIEAALAFGTGHHGTTRGCLLVLVDLAKRGWTKRVLDVGTGTGVLAIGSARLLRARVIASDIDIVAVRSARRNARINHVAPLIASSRAAGASAQIIVAHAPYQLIFANILLAPLIRLAVPLRKLAGRGARIVLSGLLPAHANAVVAIYRAQGLVLERRILLEGWVTLVMHRPSERGQKQSRPGRGQPGRLRW
ncbi:MAG TPA: 50S ribosomal protein L11 methyltransferase [Pseudolabrys sp.]|nr:50S ribosomal protein L11 methyltransferase [Pseudolabrys sp.]